MWNPNYRPVYDLISNYNQFNPKSTEEKFKTECLAAGIGSWELIHIQFLGDGLLVLLLDTNTKDCSKITGF